MNVWVVRVKRHPELQALAINEGILAIGWAQLSNLASYRDQGELDRQLRHRDLGKTRGASSNQAGQLWDFAKNITIGDLVVVPLDAENVAIGAFAGAYRDRGERFGNGRHTRRVEWIALAFSVDSLLPSLLANLDSNQRTVFRLGSDEDAAAIQEAIEAKHAARG